MQVESSIHLPIYFYKTKKKFLKNKNNFWDICHRERVLQHRKKRKMPAFRVRSKNIRNAGNHKHISNTICIHVISYNTEILVKLVDFSASENALSIFAQKYFILKKKVSFGVNQYTFLLFFASKFFWTICVSKVYKKFFFYLIKIW